MDDPKAFAGFKLWRHEFVDARWIVSGAPPDWLWIRARSMGLVVAGDFPGAPARAGGESV
jgi:hypothetical protein